LDYNIRLSWWIFTILVPVETGMNALQFFYLVVANWFMAS